MILTQITLEDFISHKKSRIDFGYGINIIVGPNGAGKTSILDGISFALFNDSENRGKKENLINSKAKKCRVTLGFTEAGVVYSVERSLERNRVPVCSFYQIVDGRKLIKSTTARACDEEIRRVLGLDKNMFLQSIYVRQGEIEALVNAKPAERKELISKLLGVEDLERAWNGMKDVIQVYRDKKSSLEGALKRRPDVEKEKAEAESNIKRLETLFGSKEVEKNGLVSEVATLQKKLALLEGKKSDFEKFDKQKGILEQKVAGFEAELEACNIELNKALLAEKTVQNLEPQVAKLSPLEAYVSQLSEKTTVERSISELDKQLSEIRELKSALEHNKQGYALYREAEAKLLEKSRLRKEFEGSDTALGAAKRLLEKYLREEKRRADLLSSAIEKASTTLGEQISVENIDDVLLKVKASHEEKVRELEAEKQALNEKAISLKQRVTDLAFNISKLSSDAESKSCPTCETELTKDRIAQLLAKYSEEKKTAEAQMVEFGEALSKLEMALKSEKDYGKQLHAIDPDQIHSLAAEVEEAKGNVATQQADVERLGQLSGSLAEIDREISKLEEGKARWESAFQEYSFAEKRLSRLPSEEAVEAELHPLVKALEEIETRLACLVKQLGYEPKDAKKELEQLRLTRQVYDQNLAIAKRKAEFESLVRETSVKLEDAKKSVLALEAQIKGLGYDEAEHSHVKTDFQNAEAKLRELEKELVRLEQEKSGFQTQVAKLDVELKALEKTAKEKQQVERYISVLNKIRDAYGKEGIQKLIRARARPVLEKATRDLFERFNLAYSDVKIDDDYNISVLGPAGEQDIDQISGGERVALAIALRLAIAQVLSGKVESIIMDEPTTHLDEERRKELVNILNSFFREGGRIIPQMLIITHHNEIQEVADIVYTVKKTGGYSSIEALSPLR
ncbi:MAG: AAA family ATPase [Candidatus Bathyarchaeota archaeon]|nr:AAA family ATPase [Candidatus Bathyarchaeota archaeon]